MQAGYDGLLRDKTRPSRIPPLGSDTAERVVAHPHRSSMMGQSHFGQGAGKAEAVQKAKAEILRRKQSSSQCHLARQRGEGQPGRVRS